jgi:hypothetical protein
LGISIIHSHARRALGVAENDQGPITTRIREL